MPDNGYRYTINRCDVPEERRPALKRFREKRLEWLSWLYKDMNHAIWPTLHTMVWMDVSLRTLTSFVAENEENTGRSSTVGGSVHGRGEAGTATPACSGEAA